MTNTCKIETGKVGCIQTKYISGPRAPYVERICLLYSGMLDNQTFGLTEAISYGEFGDNKYGPTIHYNKDKKEINFLDHKFKVLEVSPDQIILKYLDEKN